jgi:nitrite reductase/ring-hydroxylating ferredoxin subunit
LIKKTGDGYIFVCSVSDLKNEIGKRFIVDETDIAVFKSKDVIYALDNICPHQQTALIYDGFIEDGCVVCPAHGWKFNLHNGRKPEGSHGLNSYKVKIIDDDVFVKVISKEYNW